jgi:hypothetical protein
MTTLAFFLEEPSAKEMLIQLLPRFLPPDIVPKFVVFKGKQDLEKQLVKKLRGWCVPDTKFVVMRDQDAADCLAIKARLIELCQQAGKPEALVRIACHELETFYLGDLAAVEEGLGVNGLAAKQQVRKFREPDAVHSPSVELAN